MGLKAFPPAARGEDKPDLRLDNRSFHLAGSRRKSITEVMRISSYGSGKSDQTESGEFDNVLFVGTTDAKLLGSAERG